MSSKPGQTKITLPDGAVVEFPHEAWNEMLQIVQSECDEKFASGPTQLKEAYDAYLQIGLGGSRSVETQEQEQTASSGRSSGGSKAS